MIKQFELGNVQQNNEEILAFISQIKVANKQILKSLKNAYENRQELLSQIQELQNQLQYKNELIEKHEMILQECEAQVSEYIFQLESQRTQFEERLAQLEVQSTLTSMLDKVDHNAEIEKLKAKSYSTASGTQYFQMHHNQESSIFKDSNTIESMAQTEADQSLHVSQLDHKNSFGARQMHKYKGYLLQDSSVKKTKEMLQKDSFSDEFSKVPKRNDNKVQNSKFQFLTAFQNNFIRQKFINQDQ